MEWVILAASIVVVVLLVYGWRRAGRSPIPDFTALERGPVDELPTGGMYTFGHLFQFAEGTWSSLLPPPPATEPVVAIGGSSPSQFCVTWDGIYARNGDGWVREHTSSARLLWLCVTETAVYVGGAGRTLLERKGTSWEPVSLPRLPPCVLGPIAQTPSGLYVGGNNFILHARDGEWNMEPIPTKDVLMDVCTHGDDVWFVVQSGEILRSNGDGSWLVEHTADDGLGGIACMPDGTLYAVGGVGNVLTSAGDGMWRDVDFDGESQMLCVRVIDGHVFLGDLNGRIHIRGRREWFTYEGGAKSEVRDIGGTLSELLVATSSFYMT